MKLTIAVTSLSLNVVAAASNSVIRSGFLSIMTDIASAIAVKPSAATDIRTVLNGASSLFNQARAPSSLTDESYQSLKLSTTSLVFSFVSRSPA